MLIRWHVISALLIVLAGSAMAAEQDRLELPLPSKGSAVTVQISPSIMLTAEPDGDGWELAARRKSAGAHALNLLYHSRQWHGPYPSQIQAWHVEQQYFPNQRELCVTGHPIEVHINVQNPEVSGTAEDAVFTGGQVVVEWFKRRCSLSAYATP